MTVLSLVVTLITTQNHQLTRQLHMDSTLPFVQENNKS